MPLFSIVIPTFNSSRYITQCLDSIRKQLDKDFEIIIKDGMSSDGTQEIILKYKSSFPEIDIKFSSEPDLGIYDAMNKGIDQSSGEWLLFLGSDDSLYSDFVLQNIALQIQNAKSPVIYGNVIISGHAGWAIDGIVYDGYFDLEKILQKNICHQAIFYNRTVFKELGNFNIRYNVCADFDFNLRCFAKHRFSYIDLIVTKFNGGGTSVVNDDVNFSNDHINIVIINFRSQLYRAEFLRFRPYIKAILFNKASKLNFFSNCILLFNYALLTLQSHWFRILYFIKN